MWSSWTPRRLGRRADMWDTGGGCAPRRCVCVCVCVWRVVVCVCVGGGVSTRGVCVGGGGGGPHLEVCVRGGGGGGGLRQRWVVCRGWWAPPVLLRCHAHAPPVLLRCHAHAPPALLRYPVLPACFPQSQQQLNPKTLPCLPACSPQSQQQLQQSLEAHGRYIESLIEQGAMAAQPNTNAANTTGRQPLLLPSSLALGRASPGTEWPPSGVAKRKGPPDPERELEPGSASPASSSEGDPTRTTTKTDSSKTLTLQAAMALRDLQSNGGQSRLQQQPQQVQEHAGGLGGGSMKRQKNDHSLARVEGRHAAGVSGAE